MSTRDAFCELSCVLPLSLLRYPTYLYNIYILLSAEHRSSMFSLPSSSSTGMSVDTVTNMADQAMAEVLSVSKLKSYQK
jgi:hypothetical protein